MIDALDIRKLLNEFIGASEDAGHPGGEDCRLCKAVDSTHAYLAAPSVEPAPPREPTPEMYAAICDEHASFADRNYFAHVWRIMYDGWRDAALAAEAPRSTLDAMVDRFLAWPLPKDFAPDCGISFDGRKDDEWNKNKTWPVGTNLFTAEQAHAMLLHILDAPVAEAPRTATQLANDRANADIRRAFPERYAAPAEAPQADDLVVALRAQEAPPTLSLEEHLMGLADEAAARIESLQAEIEAAKHDIERLQDSLSAEVNASIDADRALAAKDARIGELETEAPPCPRCGGPTVTIDGDTYCVASKPHGKIAPPLGAMNWGKLPTLADYEPPAAPAEAPPIGERHPFSYVGEDDCGYCNLPREHPIHWAAAPAEAPPTDDLVAALREQCSGKFHGGAYARSLHTEAAARIESDAARIRAWAPFIKEHDEYLFAQGEKPTIAAERLQRELAASRERERAAYERAAKMVDDACNKRIGEHARVLDAQLQLTALAAAIRALASPDTAEQGEAK